MNEHSDLLQTLKRGIVARLRLTHVDPDAIADDEPLFGAGLGLDSIDAVELVVMLEKEFGVKLTDLVVAKSAFASVATLGKFVAASRAAAAGS